MREIGLQATKGRFESHPALEADAILMHTNCRRFDPKDGTTGSSPQPMDAIW